MAMGNQLSLDDYGNAVVVQSASTPGSQPGDGGSSPTQPHQPFLRLATSNGDIMAVDMIIRNYHSYCPETDRFYKTYDYLIYEDSVEGRLVGMIGFGVISLNAPFVVERYFNVHRDKIERYKEVANCRRLTLIDDVPRNFASASISRSLRLLRRDWPFSLRGAFTLVKPPKRGTCFIAAGWEILGYSSGAGYVYPQVNGGKPGKFSEPLRIFARKM